MLMDDLLCEKPYAMYSFFLHLNTNPKYAKLSYKNIDNSDIEELLRCSPERSNLII